MLSTGHLVFTDDLTFRFHVMSGARTRYSNLLGRTSGTVTVNGASKPAVLTAYLWHVCILMLIVCFLVVLKNKPMETTVYDYSGKGGPTLDLKMF